MANDIHSARSSSSATKPKRQKNDPPSPILSSQNRVLDSILDEVRGLQPFMSSTNDKLQQIEERWIVMEGKVLELEQRVSEDPNIGTRDSQIKTPYRGFGKS